jgi:hypothetical protein
MRGADEQRRARRGRTELRLAEGAEGVDLQLVRDVLEVIRLARRAALQEVLELAATSNHCADLVLAGESEGQAAMSVAAAHARAVGLAPR